MTFHQTRTRAGLTEHWRGRGAGYRPLLALGGEGVTRGWPVTPGSRAGSTEGTTPLRPTRCTAEGGGQLRGGWGGAGTAPPAPCRRGKAEENYPIAAPQASQGGKWGK
eukprot:gene19243-biopygen13002